MWISRLHHHCTHSSTSCTVGAWPDLQQKLHRSARADLLEQHQGTSKASKRNEGEKDAALPLAAHVLPFPAALTDKWKT